MKATRPSVFAMTRWMLDIAIVGLVAIVVLAVVLGRVVPLVGGQTLIIGGPSMEPAVPLGSAVVIGRVAPESIAVGDVVSVQNGDARAIYTHRVIRTLALNGQPYIETKGDNNPVVDGATVPAETVIGRVNLTIPMMGYVVAWLSVPSGVAFVLALGGLLVLAALLVDSVESDRQRARRATTSSGAGRGRPTLAMASGGLEAAAPIGISPAMPSVAGLVDARRRRPELGTESPSSSRRPRPSRSKRRST
ncbi:MAG TPA: signal peptidase I [Candidatus Limnocylindrales bacterium]|jgi:signal peptidase